MDEFLEKMTEILEPEITLTMETKLAEVEEWDSLGLVSFVAMVDSEYGKTMVFADIKKAQTVQDLYLLVK